MLSYRHEIVGIVTEVGSKAASHFKVGDRAGVGCFVRACRVSVRDNLCMLPPYAWVSMRASIKRDNIHHTSHAIMLVCDMGLARHCDRCMMGIHNPLLERYLQVSCSLHDHALSTTSLLVYLAAAVA